MADLTPKVFTTLVSIDDSNELNHCDTIEWKGKKWLVPKWLVAPTEGWKKPERIICLDNLKHQKIGAGFGADYLLNDPLPRSVVEGRGPSPAEGSYDVIEAPDITLPGGEKLN